MHAVYLKYFGDPMVTHRHIHKLTTINLRLFSVDMVDRLRSVDMVDCLRSVDMVDCLRSVDMVEKS